MNKVVLLVLNFLFSQLLFAQENFNILIKRNSVNGNLVTGTISLNGTELGQAFENNNLKIPAGSYKGIMRYVSQKGFVLGPLGTLMNTGDFLLEVANVIQPVDTTLRKRTDILFHAGNKAHHSLGCILLGPAKKLPEGGAVIDDDHPLRKLRLAFYGTDDPILSPNKNINITIENNYISSFSAEGNSGWVRYGNPNCAYYRTRLTRAKLSFTIDKEKNEISNARLTNRLSSESIGPCASNMGDPQSQSFTQSSGRLSGNDVEIRFTQRSSDMVKFRATFTGTIEGNNVVGSLKWERTSVSNPAYLYNIQLPLTLAKSN